MSRPPIEITNEMCEKAEELASVGMTMSEIAISLGMGERTIYEKMLAFPQFSQAIKKGQIDGIETVVNELMNLVKKGNLGAVCFYLKNRSNWADKQEVEHSGAFNVSMPPKDANTL